MDVLDAISSRRSHRAYLSKQLDEETLSTILKAGLEAPSATNRQPWHFSVVQNSKLIQEIHDAAAQIFIADSESRYHQVDCGIAVENMALAAEGLGVGSVILGWPKPAFKGDRATELKTRLECPDGYDFVVALALGYATDQKNAHDLRFDNISHIT